MTNLLNYSTNLDQQPLLHQLQKQLQAFPKNKIAAIALFSLYLATGPKIVFLFAYKLDGLSPFDDSVQVIPQLSVQGKLAQVRAIAEELPVFDQIARAAQ